MSYTEVKVVGKDGEVLTYGEEIRNSHGIPVVWDALYQKYCENPERYFMSDRQRGARLKEAAEKATEGERVCLRWTYDRAWVARKNIPKLCEAIKIFADEHIPANITQTFRRTGDALLKIYNEFPDAIGACMTGSSAGDDLWYVEDDELDYGRPYHFGLDKGHWEIYGDDALGEGVPEPPPSPEFIEAHQRRIVESFLAICEEVESDPDRLGGSVTIKGTRVSLARLFTESIGVVQGIAEEYGTGQAQMEEILTCLASVFETVPDEY